MKRMMKWMGLGAAVVLLIGSCEKLDDRIEEMPDAGDEKEPSSISLEELTEIFAEVPFGTAQMQEVHDAVLASSGNGYDEEYTLRNLLQAPGTGVGADKLITKAPVATYETPLRDLLAETVRARAARTKAEGGETMDPEAYLQALEESDVQLYWPFHDSWDGETPPILTFDPGDNSSTNVGYRIVETEGERRVEKLRVDEQTAMESPVWVINRNDDANYTTIDVLRKNDPDWGTGGSVSVSGTKAEEEETRSLIMLNFRALTNFDTWFCGGSEVWIKCGAIEDFRASTEAELRLYNPSITDFMIIVPRSKVGRVMKVNTVLVSEFTDQLDKIVFMIVEDDGGTVTSWKCNAVVKYNSKAYGIELELPFRSYDDIIWRGQLSRKYLTKYSGYNSRYGDVELTLIME